MTKLTLKLAMLCMVFLLLAACGSSGHASSATSAVGQVSQAVGRRQLAAAVSAPRAAPTNAPRATSVPPTATSSPTPEPVITFAVLGDNGEGDAKASDVAKLIAGWRPSFIIDVGDLYYNPAGQHGTAKYDATIGKFYCAYLKDITTSGASCPQGLADKNRFFPAPGNHEYSDAHINNYLDYFDLPGNGYTNTSGNERYYDVTWGPVHLFALNSNTVEPDGATAQSKQAQWLKAQLAASKSPWNIVFFHHPPYSSGTVHGSQTWMRWPFAQWGAQVVLSGHEHDYERIMKDGIVYFVNGIGGGGALYPFGKQPIDGSAARVNDNWGAQKVTVTSKEITFELYTLDGKLRDQYSIHK